MSTIDASFITTCDAAALCLKSGNAAVLYALDTSGAQRRQRAERLLAVQRQEGGDHEDGQEPDELRAGELGSAVREGRHGEPVNGADDERLGGDAQQADPTEVATVRRVQGDGVVADDRRFRQHVQRERRERLVDCHVRSSGISTVRSTYRVPRRGALKGLGVWWQRCGTRG